MCLYFSVYSTSSVDFFPGTYTVNVFVLQPCFESLSLFLFLISNRAPLDAIRGGVSGEKFNRNPYAAVSDVEVNVFFRNDTFFVPFQHVL